MILRLGAGSFLVYGHGWGKLVNFSERAARFSDPIGLGSPASLTLAVFAEVFCSLAVILGLFTRLAVVPIVILLGVAFFIHHAADPFPRKELALVYMVPFLTLLFTGAGQYSLDAKLGRLWSRRSGP